MELIDLQQWIADRLASDVFFTPGPAVDGKPAPGTVPVVTEKMGDIVARLEVALLKLGVGVVVVTPLGTLDDPSVPIIDLGVPIVVQVQENALFNQGNSGTKKAALTIVRRVMQLLHHAPLPTTLKPGPEEERRLTLTETPFEEVEKSPILTYNVNLRAGAQFLPEEPTPASP